MNQAKKPPINYFIIPPLLTQKINRTPVCREGNQSGNYLKCGSGEILLVIFEYF